ncbi:hypothetical protein NQ176_g4816 [Zarea fungicola]|uniref:Uncharacterized protein n=1 Tax=Zarea fungicola TaxID=93591 RepID=A0ACC1NBH5_9HYPO|nr:hypothetical protein NQ176_g4816 [Lecanicillium fungicola]
MSTHHGHWDSSTREIPALAFIEKYANTVDSLDLTAYPFHDWYAPDSVFYNGDGISYRGGNAIWSWMKGLFSPFTAVHHQVECIRLFHEQVDFQNAKIDAETIILETSTVFTVKGLEPRDQPIVVPRLLQFTVGASQVAGQGTDGMQIFVAKAWWDTAVLQKEILARKEASNSEQG